VYTGLTHFVTDWILPRLMMVLFRNMHVSSPRLSETSGGQELGVATHSSTSFQHAALGQVLLAGGRWPWGLGTRPLGLISSSLLTAAS